MKPISFLLSMALIPGGLWANPSHALTIEGVDEILARLKERYGNIRSLAADFRQVYRSHRFELQESGILLVKKPARMYWEYREPSRKFFVTDGKKAYFHVPEDRQVMVADFPAETDQTPLLFLFGQADVRDNFEVTLETNGQTLHPGSLWLNLHPLRPSGEFSRILVKIDRQTYLINGLSIFEILGGRSDYILTNIRENIPIPNQRFRFKIPPGVEVIRQDSVEQP